MIQRQLGHCNLGVTSVYLQGIDTAEIVELVHGRPAPVIPASNGLASRRMSRPMCCSAGAPRVRRACRALPCEISPPSAAPVRKRHTGGVMSLPKEAATSARASGTH